MLLEGKGARLYLTRSVTKISFAASVLSTFGLCERRQWLEDGSTRGLEVTP